MNRNLEFAVFLLSICGCATFDIANILDLDEDHEEHHEISMTQPTYHQLLKHEYLKLIDTFDRGHADGIFACVKEIFGISRIPNEDFLSITADELEIYESYSQLQTKHRVKERKFVEGYFFARDIFCGDYSDEELTGYVSALVWKNDDRTRHQNATIYAECLNEKFLSNTYYSEEIIPDWVCEERIEIYETMTVEPAVDYTLRQIESFGFEKCFDGQRFVEELATLQRRLAVLGNHRVERNVREKVEELLKEDLKDFHMEFIACMSGEIEEEFQNYFENFQSDF